MGGQFRNEVSTESGSDRIATLQTPEIAKKRPGRYRSRY
jgi:hypothetical protein